MARPYQGYKIWMFDSHPTLSDFSTPFATVGRLRLVTMIGCVLKGGGAEGSCVYLGFDCAAHHTKQPIVILSAAKDLVWLYYQLLL